MNKLIYFKDFMKEYSSKRITEDFFSIFPSNHYDDDLAVNIAISDVLRKFVNSVSTDYKLNEGPHGGFTVHNDEHFYTYVVKSFDKHNQIIVLEIFDGVEAKLMLATLTLSSKELKKALLTDIKYRFNIQ